MIHHELYVSVAQVRGADTNSLLRLYDQARLVLRGAPNSQTRRIARCSLDRINRELGRRGAAVNGGPA